MSPPHPIALLKKHFFGETDVYHPNEFYATLHSRHVAEIRDAAR